MARLLHMAWLVYPAHRTCSLSLAVVLTTSGCASMAKVANLTEESCRTSITRHLSYLLIREGEKLPIAEALAHKTVSAFATNDFGPHPFAVAAPSGEDYQFFIQHKGADCALTLSGRQKGFMSYTNNVTYIATEILPDCTCAE